ncbi:DEAD/DEAH box helicase, partial [Candidatus Bathyarchaeota archaeon]|nr:DEAD/DEAH box helicase [Candidatus Bathyarchaeota archaeon]
MEVSRVISCEIAPMWRKLIDIHDKNQYHHGLVSFTNSQDNMFFNRFTSLNWIGGLTIHLTLAREHWDTLKENLQNIDTIEPREYQTNIVNEAKDCNSLVILPTALGKTFIAMRIAMQRLQLYPWGKVIVLAPTRPLVNQHLNTFKVFLAGSHLKCSGSEVLSFFEASGRIPSKKRAGMYGNANFIFATPQTLKNDIQRGSCSLHDCVLLVLDE